MELDARYSSFPAAFLASVFLWTFVLPAIFAILHFPSRRLRDMHESVHLMQSRLEMLISGGRISSKSAEGLRSELAQVTALIHSMMWDLEEARSLERARRYMFRGPDFYRLKQLTALVGQLRANIRAFDSGATYV
ncbi:hypothetical protein FKP32DRAFT_1595887 [Trametes sanguinea]|nr:hypothetical protein FKP32DRAFT_1595887 [Trametes sanguinea]